MDPRERADAALARARARGAFVVTPDDAVSPMDASNTVQIPRSVVAAADQPEVTMIIPAAVARGQQQPHPQQQQGYPQHGPQHNGRPHNGHPQQHNGQQHNGHQQGPNFQTGPHQPVPYPGNQHPGNQQQPGQYQSGQHQPVPPPAGQGRPEQPAQQRQPTREEQQLDGLVPTTQQPAIERSALSRRLDGQ